MVNPGFDVPRCGIPSGRRGAAAGRGWIAIIIGAALAACGSPKVAAGEADAGGSTESSFSAPRAATDAELQAAQAPLAGLLGLQGAPDLAKLADLVSLPTILSRLLGDPSANPLSALGASPDLGAAWQGVGANMGPLLQGALASGCVSLGSAGLVFNGCAVPIQQAGVQGTVKIDGSLGLTASGLKLDLLFAGAFEAATACGALKLHLFGELGLAGGACKGSLQMDAQLDGKQAGQAISLALSEALSLDLAFQAGQLCASGGSALAMREWTLRPDGQTATTLPDIAAKLEFSACGAATIAFSPKDLSH